MNKKRMIMFFKVIAFISLTLAGVYIGLIIKWDIDGKGLIYGSMTIVSLGITSFVAYYSAMKSARKQNL